MNRKIKFSRRDLLAIGIAVGILAIADLCYLFGCLRDLSHPKNPGTVLPVPSADSVSGLQFSITPDTQKLLCIENRFKRQKVCLSDFPPEGPGSYREVLTIPNYEYRSSRPAFCAADASKFATVGCYWRGADVPEFPEFKDKKEYESWVGAHPRYTLKTVNGETDIDYSLAGFYLVIADLNEGKSDFLLRIPDEISGEPANITTSLCWPLRDLIFLGIRDSVYQVSLRKSPPSLEKIMTLPKDVEGALFGGIKVMWYNAKKDTLTAAAAYVNTGRSGNKAKSTVQLAFYKFDFQEEMFIPADPVPEPIISSLPVMSADNTVIAAVVREETPIKAFLKHKGGEIAVMSAEGAEIAAKAFPAKEAPVLETVSPDGKAVVYRDGLKYRYRQIGPFADESRRKPAE